MEAEVERIEDLSKKHIPIKEIVVNGKVISGGDISVGDNQGDVISVTIIAGEKKES